MNTTTTLDSNATEFAALIGMDWGDQEHAFYLSVPGLAQPESGKLSHAPEKLHPWMEELEKRFGGRPVALAMESSRGALVHVLANYPWLTLFPVNPITSARFRKAFIPSGAKDDLPDAKILLDILRAHRDKLKPLRWEDARTRELAALVRARRDTVDRRTQIKNQLIAGLKSYYPQALELIGDNMASPLALDFLKRWPDLISLKAARPSTIQSFYQAHNVRRPELIKERLALIKASIALTTDDAIVSVGVLQLKLHLELMEVFNKHIDNFDAEIKQAFGEHADAAIFKSLPGAGPVLAPRLLAAFGTDRSLFPDAASFQKFAGLAPVREKSGGQLWTHWRWQAPIFLRQSLIEWAGQTVVYCDWASHYYQRMRAKGKKHHAIMRALAFKWVRIIWKLWQTRTTYNEEKYLKAMSAKNSPNLPPVANAV